MSIATELDGPTEVVPRGEHETFMIETYEDIATVILFNDKVIIITKSGSVMVINRYDGQLRTA